MPLLHTHTTPGFVEVLESVGVEVTLVTLKPDVSSAIGAAVLGAREAGVHLCVDHGSNTTVLHHYKPNSQPS